MAAQLGVPLATTLARAPAAGGASRARPLEAARLEPPPELLEGGRLDLPHALPRQWDLPPLDDVLGPSEGVAATAGGLRALGVSRGDVVAWQRPNGPDVVALYRACWRLGAVAAPIHHQASDAETARLLARVDPTVFFAAEDELPDGPPAAATGQAGDVAVVLWTAGSSGEPKGVLHTQRTLAYKARVMVHVHGLKTDDAVLMPAPLAHISGLLNGLLVPQTVGMRVGLHGPLGPRGTPST